MPARRQEIATGALSGRAYVLGGYDKNGNFTATVEVYNRLQMDICAAAFQPILPTLTGAFAICARSQSPKKSRRTTARTNAKGATTASPTRLRDSMVQRGLLELKQREKA